MSLQHEIYGAFDDDWTAYHGEVERLTGRPITDGVLIDMLYTTYLGNVPVADAVKAVDRMMEAANRATQVLAQHRERPTMDHDPDAAAWRRFQPDVAKRRIGRRAPRAGLIRRLPRRRGETLGLIGWAFVVAAMLVVIVYAIHKGG